MAASTIRTAILAALGLLAVGLIVLALLPALASTQLVRDRVALELSLWSGYRVSFAGSPHVDVWPGFGASLDRVRFADWDDPEGEPVLTVERIDIDLSPLAALRGDVAFSTARFDTFVLSLDAKGTDAALGSGQGRLKHAVQSAREAVAADSRAPNVSRLPSDRFGTVVFSNGRVVAGEAGQKRDILTGLTGRLAWPALNGSASLKAEAQWRGEAVAIEANSAAPLVLAVGGTAPLRLSVASEPLTARFDGTATSAGSGYVEGDFSLESPSLARTLEWIRAAMSPGASLGSLAVSGRIAGGADRLKIGDARVSVGGNPGTGLLELMLAGPVPALSGTLAFGRIDLNALLAAFTRPADHGSGTVSDFDFALTSGLALDLRLSAEEAMSGNLTLADVAATAQIRDGVAVLDISDAEVFGGSLQTGLRMDATQKPGQSEFRLLAENIDGAALSSALPWAQLVPRARGSVSMILRGTGTGWNAILDRADGSLSAKFGPGAIANVDLKAFMARLQDGDFFAFNDVATGSLPITAADVKSTIDDGIARIETAKVWTEGNVISLSGIVPYPGRGLALSGTISPESSATPAMDGEDRMFFVGGSWSAPFVSPILQAQ